MSSATPPPTTITRSGLEGVAGLMLTFGGSGDIVMIVSLFLLLERNWMYIFSHLYE